MVIGAQSFSPTVIMTVADLSVMECEVMVDETDIRNVKLGQAAEVRVDALEGLKIKGEVTEIGASAIVRGQTAAADELQRRQHRQPGQGLQGHDHPQGPARRTSARASTPPPTSRPPRARERARRAHPGRGGARGEQGGQGRRPRRDARARRRATRTTDTGKVRAKVEEKDGVFVVEKDKAVFTPGQDRHHGRDRHRGPRRAQGGRGDRDRLLQDAAHPEGRGQDQGRGRRGKKS